MKLFGRGSEKEREQNQHRHEIVLAHTQGKAASQDMNMQRHLLNTTGPAYFLQEDENVVSALKQYCPELIPAFSRMNATSRIEKPRDRRILELRLEDMLLHKEMELGDEGDVETLNFIKALRVFGIFRILDALGGYRGRLVTEEIERTTHVIEEPKKKGIL